MQKYTMMIGAILFFFVACKESPPPKTEVIVQKEVLKKISVEETKELLSVNSDIIIVDVRTEEETNEGTLAGAIVIDVKKDNFAEEIEKLDKESTYLVYCRSGKRSTRATDKMVAAGFKNLYEMKGGYLDWLDSK